jgi:hypothetical protein
MLGLGRIPLFQGLETQTTKHRKHRGWPLLLRQKRPQSNLRISAGSSRMKTTKRPYFIATSRRIILRSQKLFCFHLHFQLLWWRHYGVFFTSFNLKLFMDVWSIFEKGKPHLKKPSMISHHPCYSAVLIGLDSAELFLFVLRLSPNLNRTYTYVVYCTIQYCLFVI